MSRSGALALHNDLISRGVFSPPPTIPSGQVFPCRGSVWVFSFPTCPLLHLSRYHTESQRICSQLPPLLSSVVCGSLQAALSGAWLDALYSPTRLGRLPV